MQLSIRRPKAVFGCELAREVETRWSRFTIVVRAYRRSTAPKSLSVSTGWTRHAPVTKGGQDWAYRSRTGASERTAAKLNWSAKSNLVALSASGCRGTGRVIRTRKKL